MKKTITFVTVAALIFACAKKAEAPATASASPAPSSQTTAAAAQPATSTSPSATQPAQSGKIVGTIVETMDSGGYTYMRINAADGEHWVATPQVKVKVGQAVAVTAQMTMEKFVSSTLNRTFDKIVFATMESGSAPAQAATAGTPPVSPMTGAMGTPADHMRPKVDVGDIAVPKAEGNEGKTVSEVWSHRAHLAGKEVVVRGKVVKFLGGIMGTNFMHIRDGSGSEQSGDNDLTVTTSDTASVGEIVTLRGTVQVDKDFGAGYRYPVIVEKAKLTK